MEVKFTPGPWMVQTNKDEYGNPVFIISSPEKGFVPTPFTHFYPNDGTVKPRFDENGFSLPSNAVTICKVHDLPTARLIAAVPDLLEELTNLLLWAQDVHRLGKDARLNYTGMDDARVAIKKATGVWHE